MSLPLIIKDIEDRFKISGGTLTGNIEINQSSYPMIMIKDLGQGRRGEFIYNINEEVIISNYKDENNRSLLFLRNENNVNNSLQLSRVVDGQWSSYNLYGEHNKPTAADVGALPLSGGVVTGDVTFKGFAHFHGDIGGPEGGQISFNKPETDTSFGSGLTVDVYKNSFRLFADHNGALKIFDFDFSSHPGGNSVILHSGNSIKYPSRQSLTIPEIYDGTTIRKDLKAFMETNANLHKATAEYSGEFNLYRFFAASDESNYASYNLPCVDSHVLTFSIDHTTSWIRLLALDMRTSDIYTISKTSSGWGTWKKLLDSENYTNYTVTKSHTHNFINHLGNVTAETGTNDIATAGMSMALCYNNGYPINYGNVIRLKGSGMGEVLVGWSGTSGAHASVYYRSQRDTSDANWSSWSEIYSTGNSNGCKIQSATPATHMLWAW